MKLGIIPNAGITRIIPPPLPPDGGGFWYLRRPCAGGVEILLDEDGDYVQFGEDEAAANKAARQHGNGAYAKWMPKLRSN